MASPALFFSHIQTEKEENKIIGRSNVATMLRIYGDIVLG